ncbi:MAG: hypothetical protein JNK82_02585 [Myxococcaceae bacterium]|nr:hypothetical protein [Myxococcaceae bacterium]
MTAGASRARSVARRALARPLWLRIEPEWAADVVRLALPNAPGATAEYQLEAGPLYCLPPGERPGAFARLDALWVERLGLAGVLRDAAAPFAAELGRRPLCVLRPAALLEEGADLGRYDDAPAVRLALSPRRMLAPEAALAFCTHEVAHVADMLDPSFGYDPHRPLPGTTRPERELARERFRMLWGASIDGRLRERGLPALLSLDGWHALARRAFPQGPPAGLIDALLRGRRPPHDELLARCTCEHGPAPGQPCPLCRFPTHAWGTQAEVAAAAARIAIDFPRWAPPQGACAQCLECYR